MASPKPIVHVIGEIIQAVSDEILETLQEAQSEIEAINYQYGHPLEIIETLKQYDNDPAKRFEKYPLVMLIQDFPEVMGKVGGYYSEVRLRIVIAHSTQPDYKAAQRYENTFLPILYPIYDALLAQLVDSRYFVVADVESIKHTKKDRLFWGRENLGSTDANVFCDYLDAIEITDLQLTVDLDTCTLYFNP